MALKVHFLGILGSILLVLWAAGPSKAGEVLRPAFTGKDKNRSKISVLLRPVVSGVDQPTDLAPIPGDPGSLIILEKTGAMKCYFWMEESLDLVHRFNVKTNVELGLLGITFHPKYRSNHKVYLNYNPLEGIRRTRISEWILKKESERDFYTLKKEKIILEVEQPYDNHNAGQLAFGPDGYLYIGLGDGGSALDPQRNAQNRNVMLGKMLRIDVDRSTSKTSYAIPSDNPFRNQKGTLPEIWALGLRNPWKYSFSPGGQLIVADVGQFQWEEISIVESGKNYGWDFREGAHCHRPKKNCQADNLIDPIYDYPRDEGRSITGGFVVEGESIPDLKGKYLFGDFVTGKIWAIEVPAKEGGKSSKTNVWSLGKFSISPSTFGKTVDGKIVVADFYKGKIYQLALK